MSRLLLLGLLTLLGVPAFAQQDAPPLGRLFLTPEQRAALDNARRNKIRSEAVAAAVVKQSKPPAVRSVLINGVVTRSDGETIVWVNGKPIEGETPDGMQFQVTPQTQGGTVTVREPDRGRRVEIKVGQQVDLVTGRVQEPFERRPPAAVPASKPAPPERGFIANRPKERDLRDDRTVNDVAPEPVAPPAGKTQQ